MNYALLGIVEEAGINVLTLTEGLEAEELWRSRLTRAEVKHQVLNMSATLGKIHRKMGQQLEELDWDGWSSTTRQLEAGNVMEDEALWFAARALVPATLMWLRFYRQRHPELFEFKM